MNSHTQGHVELSVKANSSWEWGITFHIYRFETVSTAHANAHTIGSTGNGLYIEKKLFPCVIETN